MNVGSLVSSQTVQSCLVILCLGSETLMRALGTCQFVKENHLASWVIWSQLLTCRVGHISLFQSLLGWWIQYSMHGQHHLHLQVDEAACLLIVMRLSLSKPQFPDRTCTSSVYFHYDSNFCSHFNKWHNFTKDDSDL
jgi:hypothetical protein